MKIGDKLIMYFHGAGVVSEEECVILSFDDKTITISDGEDGKKFHRKTGKCLGDDNFGGFYRTIKPCIENNL